MRRLSIAFLLRVLLWLCLYSMLDAGASAGSVSIAVDPDHIRSGTFYNGESVKVTADVPPCDGVVLVLTSEPEEIVLNRRGKIGLVWLNVAKITVEGAPGVYILASSDAVNAIGSRGELERLGLGFEALRNRVTFRSEKPLTGREFDEFLKLKRHAGTYNDDIAIAMERREGGRQAATATLRVPSVTPPGQYRLRLYCFEDGAPIENASALLTIEKAGLPRLESELAHTHAAAYGIIAVLFAMVAGITMGVIFSSRGG
jgi:uncharacterized protein (TIGR02186 family)